jgi:hypothetical protein
LKKPATGKQPETGIYWNDTQGGRGFTVEVQNDVVVTTMYHYNADGTPTWNFMVGDITSGIASGAFNGQTGGQFINSAYRFPSNPISKWV